MATAAAGPEMQAASASSAVASTGRANSLNGVSQIGLVPGGENDACSLFGRLPRGDQANAT